MSIPREVLCMENRAKLICARISVAGGTPSIVAGTSKGVSSTAKAATGKVTATLDKPYKRVLGCWANVQQPGNAPTNTIAQAVDPDTSTVSTTGVLILYTSSTKGGVLADVGTGQEIDVLLLVSDSDV
jgi:hypothetical protein